MKRGDYVKVKLDAYCPAFWHGKIGSINSVKNSVKNRKNNNAILQYYLIDEFLREMFFWEEELDLLTPPEILAAKLEGKI